ncbi:MAG: hypothetical protein L3J39_08590 [Verrucomicrobiales bacterium]|nr:hypothetical protein [Verrucomicrobiales bacterium]
MYSVLKMEFPSGSKKGNVFQRVDANTLATVCLFSAPVAKAMHSVNFFTGWFQYTSVSLYFFIFLCAILVAGFVAGVLALFNVYRHGGKGVFWKASIGLVIISLLVIISVRETSQMNAEYLRNHSDQEAKQAELGDST